MIFDFLRKLAGHKNAAETAAEESVTYNGFEIRPEPRKEEGGWRVAGVLSKGVDTERKEHAFIRADIYAGKDDAVAASISKGKRLIDEQGDAVFGK